MFNVLLHFGNAWLCFRLVRLLTGRARTAMLCSLVFALHPLQVESVAWLSELRGLTSSAFGLAALNVFVLSRQESERARSRGLMAVSVLLVGCALLCKPNAAVLPLVALAIDRIVLRTRWREALTGAGIWAAFALPFVLITRSIQPVPVGGHSLFWQRPFIAGDSLAFYVFKALWPIDLGIDYGRTPTSAMSHAWGYLAWVVPVALLVAAYLNRRRRPITWLGAVLFLTFLLPTLGLLPFAYQAYSTVADRYVYLALIGVGLIASEAFDYVRPQRVATLGAAALFIMLAVLSFNQSGYWLTSPAFLRHTIEVNPSAGFAYNNLGDTVLARGDLNEALTDYQACIERDPTRTRAYVNLAEVYTALNQPADAERAIAQAEKRRSGGGLPPLHRARAHAGRRPYRSRHRARGDTSTARCSHRIPHRGSSAAKRSCCARRSQEGRRLDARTGRSLGSRPPRKRLVTPIRCESAPGPFTTCARSERRCVTITARGEFGVAQRPRGHW